jgi:hypothetical protein
MQPLTNSQTSKLTLTLEHLSDAQTNLQDFVANEKKQNSFASAICSGIVNDLQANREIIKIALHQINGI